MAKTKIVKVPHRPPSVPKAKYEHLIALRSKAAKMAKEEAKERMGALVGLAGCAAVGWAEKNGKMPSMFGIEPTAVIGAVLGFVVPAFVKGDAGHMAAELGLGVAGVAAYKIGKGDPIKVGEDNWSPR